MIRNATGSCRLARPAARPALVIIAALSLAAPAAAQKIVTEEDTSVSDVMLTPLTDLNLARDPIPPVLVRAYTAPYDDIGLTTCDHVKQEIGNLDAVLGEDFDTPRAAQKDDLPESMAQSFLAGFIPFRGVIRHLSGAKRHEYEFRQAITAGLVRRAYLKGLGQKMDCPYPARPAPPHLMVHPEGMADEMPQERTADQVD